MKKQGLVKEMEPTSLFQKVTELLNTAKHSVAQMVNHTMVLTYFEIGRMIVDEEQQGERRAEYGKRLLQDLSFKLRNEFGKGFSVDNLENMRKFYLVYSDRNITDYTHLKKSETLSRKSSQINPVNFNLSWSHYLKLIRIDDYNERRFYEIEAHQNGWSLRELQRQFDSALFQRLALSRDKKQIKELSEKGHVITTPEESLKDPYILEFIGLPEQAAYTETSLEQKLIDKLEIFLLELGKGYTFVGRQVRFSFNEKHFRVDLVFYNRILRSFVLVDLKIGEIKHQDLGQMQMYVNYYDRFVKLPDENRTIGIILCRDKDDTLVEISLPEDNKQIFASRYQTILPSKEQLKKIIESKTE